MNTTALSRLAGMDLSAFTGHWLMHESRVKALNAKIAGVLSGAVAPQARLRDERGVEHEDSYAIVGGVAVIKVVGLLTKYPMPCPELDEWFGFCPTLPIMEALNEAIADERVKEVAFMIDSPGGMVAGTSELAEAIAVADKIKPCRAIVSDLAASGGYYIASQCRSIACNAMGEVGCIGVYAVLMDDSKFYESLGVEFTVISSGGVKGLGADGKVTEEFKEDQKRGVLAMYDKFVTDVARGREHAGMTADQARQLGDGRTWIAKQALGLKLIDSIASAADALSNINIQLSGANAPAVTPAPQAASAASSGTPKVADSGDERIVMDPKKRAYLESVGLKTDATEDEATTFYNLLSAEKQAEADAAADGEEATVDETVAGVAKDGKLASTANIETKAIATGSPLPDLIAACDGDKAVAADYFVANMTVEQAKAAYGAVKAAKADAARAHFEASGQAALPLAGGTSQTATTNGDPEATAKAEWSKMSAADRLEWSDEPTYVAYRKRQIARGK
ncbi:MAG: S49 family peptidase [Tepidisphaeraceae bacterium]